jgi:hypothetical protein
MSTKLTEQEFAEIKAAKAAEDAWYQKQGQQFAHINAVIESGTPKEILSEVAAALENGPVKMGKGIFADGEVVQPNEYPNHDPRTDPMPVSEIKTVDDAIRHSKVLQLHLKEGGRSNYVTWVPVPVEELLKKRLGEERYKKFCDGRKRALARQADRKNDLRVPSEIYLACPVWDDCAVEVPDEYRAAFNEAMNEQFASYAAECLKRMKSEIGKGAALPSTKSRWVRIGQWVCRRLGWRTY